MAIAIFTKKGEVLLQQRSMKRLSGPGEWKITAAGHVFAGESPKKAVIREVYEELGIKIEPVFHCKHFDKLEDREARFFWTYYAIVKKRLPLVLDKEEVMNARWIEISKLSEFAEKNNYSLTSLSHKMIVELAMKLKFI